MSNTHEIPEPTQEEILDWINEQRIAGEASDFDKMVDWGAKRDERNGTKDE